MDALREAASRAPERLAVDHADGVWSYAELDARVDGLARTLAAELASCPPGGRVALLLETCEGLVAWLHAVPRAGFSVAPLSTRLTPTEIAAALRSLEAVALVADAENLAPAAEAVAAAARGTRLLRSGELEQATAERAPRVSLPQPRALAGELAVLWTSGTAGRPRGVSLTAANFAANAHASRSRLGLDPDDRWYLALSCAHIGGLALVMRAAWLGAAVVVRGPFTADGFDALVDAGAVTHASLVPTMLLRALDVRQGRAPPASLRCVLIGGARTPGILVARALEEGWPVALTYGMTEACSQVATAPPDLVRAKPGTVGAPLEGTEVRVGDAGELLVRGPTVAAAYVGTDEPLVDAGGWLHTGDLGSLDADGHLHVTGRLGDRIISGGVNVDPTEVEDVLRAHPGVRDAAVVGLADAEWGERVAAAVVRAPGARVDAAALDRLARERLTAAKVPRKIVFVDDLPRNANGKVDPARLRALLDAAQGQA